MRWNIPGLVALAMLALPARAGAQSCMAELGARRAQALVERCVEISPATRPPCNASNACSLIRSEIRRGCALAGSDKPAWCNDEVR